MLREPGLFKSYWIAGYEGADHINGKQIAQSMNAANQHDVQLSGDYDLLKQFNIKTVRESIGWRLAEENKQFNWHALEHKAKTAQVHGVQVIWTLMHYGMPIDIDPFGPKFVGRFAKFCEAAARKLKPYSDDAPFYQPLNEISFLSWAMTHTGLIHPFNPSFYHRSFELKRQLVLAALRGSEAIWSVDPRARIIHTDPIIHITAPINSSFEHIEDTKRYNEYAFQAWDMLCGDMEPGLGGSRKHLDIIGLNYYHENQWEHGTNDQLHWHLKDPRRLPFNELATKAWQRYQRPMFIAETSHVGEGRGDWLDDMGAEIIKCEARGVAIDGICLYPVIDRPDWENPDHWHKSGLWDVENIAEPVLKQSQMLDIHLLKNSPLETINLNIANPTSVLAKPISFKRVLNQPYADSLRYWQFRIPAVSNFKLTFNNSINGDSPMQTLLVFSHLRWNFVFQRPQHLLSRLANQYKIIFVEEPVNNAHEDYLERMSPCANVEVLRPHLNSHANGFDDAHAAQVRALVDAFLSQQQIQDFWLWFYTPLALPITQGLNVKGIIYDCMDELSAFKNASPLLVERENALFKVADIVFTGGPSLYQSKRLKHANVYCFASSVDAEHFAPANLNKVISQSTKDNSQSSIAYPRIGYFGVIDERIDITLISTLALAHPDWQIVMVGPVVKIDANTLPRHSNIHWLGQKDYQELPGLIASWDLCMMPFALNESTQFISPTKTLEYMAAERAIVSTNITDVAEPYGHIVPIANTHEEFIKLCELLLAESAISRLKRLNTMRDIVAKTSWNKTALAMHDIIHQFVKKAVILNDAVATPHSLLHYLTYTKPINNVEDHCISDKSNQSVDDSTENKLNERKKIKSENNNHYETIILGAGPTGLSAAYHLGEDCLLLEKQSTIGGWCRSIVDHGFTFDYAGHIMFSNDPYVLELYELLLGDNIHWQNREAWIYSKEVYTRYPFQGALYGLPPDVLKECVVGAIEARFGPVKNEARREVANSIERRGVKKIVSEAQAPQNFEEFIYKVWGAGVAKHFAIPYNKKLWAVPLNQMETSWLGNRVPMPDLEEMIEGALKPVGKPMGPNARFGYPLKGGFQALMDGFLPFIKHKLKLNAEVKAISPNNRTVTMADGTIYHYEHLISTLPLPKLVLAMGIEAPIELQNAAKGLRHVSVKCINLGIKRENITDKHWIYYPEESLFHRIFVQGNASPHCNAPGGFGLTCEITYSEYKQLNLNDDALIKRCIDDCISVGMINADDEILTANVLDMPCAYVVYDHERARNVAVIRDWLAKANIVLSGRYSEWEYYNSDHAFIAGKKAAEAILANSSLSKLNFEDEPDISVLKALKSEPFSVMMKNQNSV